MFPRLLVFLLVSTILIDQDYVEAKLRQKRCIVIQKQSGTHGDSTEEDGGDEEYRKPEPKVPRPDRLRRPYADENKSRDVENFYPELVKYKASPMKSMNKEYRKRNRFFRKYL